MQEDVTEAVVASTKPKKWNTPRSQQLEWLQNPETSFHPMALLSDGPIVILDTETTGLDHKVEKIIEIAAVKLYNGEIIERFSTLINPEQPIRHSSFKIHHISQEMVESAPTMAEVIPQFEAFMGDLPYAAHSVVFDYSFITEAYKKHLGKRFLNPRICTLELFKAVFPEEHSHGLSALSARFGIESFVNHRALDDAEQLAAVFDKLKNLYIQKNSWKYSQLENVPYLLERYIRLSKAAQTLQSEMADLKEVFKLYFTEGGVPIQASTGEVMTGTLKRQYDYESAALMDCIEDFNLWRKVAKINLKALDKLLFKPIKVAEEVLGEVEGEPTETQPTKTPIITEEQRQALLETRTMISQGWTLNIAKLVPPATKKAPPETDAVAEAEETPFVIAEDTATTAE
ncbi:MAG: 3'-5' exonuclease [Candidatus Melainabacteria bacterium]|jgi:DNA polymerase III epsilon subunit family exonuclease|nr:3'-5' exonuclease [Candidatus Melainabacteria bacterium]